MPMYGVGVHGARKSSRRQRGAACLRSTALNLCIRADDARKNEGISPRAEFAFGIRAVRSVVFLRL